MLIISQDKRSIINFDKVERLNYINNDKQKELMKESSLDIFAPLIKETTGMDFTAFTDFGIYVYFSNGQTVMIGEYKTEERVNEVLEEIINSFCEKLVYTMPKKEE